MCVRFIAISASLYQRFTRKIVTRIAVRLEDEREKKTTMAQKIRIKAAHKHI